MAGRLIDLTCARTASCHAGKFSILHTKGLPHSEAARGWRARVDHHHTGGHMWCLAT